MSVTQPSGGYGGPPPSRYPYPGDRDSQSRPIPPRLPSMSSLLNHEPFNEVPPMKNPFTARQHQAPYNTQPPPPVGPPHPSYTSHMDPNVAAHQTYHTLQPSTGPQQLQTPPQSMFMSLPSAHTSSLTSEPRREIKPIRVRRADQKAQDPNQGFIYNGVSYRSSDLSPTQYSSDQESQYSRRGSTFSEHSSRGQSTPQGQTMQISGLLADEPSPRREKPAVEFMLRMRQQPVAARACGFGERDRRVIDPPPILQMDVRSPDMTPTEISTLIRSPYSVIHCTLWDPETDTDATAMPGTTDKRQQRRLMGTLVSSPFVGKDEHGVEGCFFTFPDLSVRTPGKYSLKFALVNLDMSRMGPGQSAPVRSVIWSSDFQVFNAKDFGGMRASTALTKTLKGQGCLISVKKGNGKNDDEEEYDDDDGDGPSKRGKRPKR